MILDSTRFFKISCTWRIITCLQEWREHLVLLERYYIMLSIGGGRYERETFVSGVSLAMDDKLASGEYYVWYWHCIIRCPFDAGMQVNWEMPYFRVSASIIFSSHLSCKANPISCSGVRANVSFVTQHWAHTVILFPSITPQGHPVQQQHFSLQQSLILTPESNSGNF